MHSTLKKPFEEMLMAAKAAIAEYDEAPDSFDAAYRRFIASLRAAVAQYESSKVDGQWT